MGDDNFALYSTSSATATIGMMFSNNVGACAGVVGTCEKHGFDFTNFVPCFPWFDYVWQEAGQDTTGYDDDDLWQNYVEHMTPTMVHCYSDCVSQVSKIYENGFD